MKKVRIFSVCFGIMIGMIIAGDVVSVNALTGIDSNEKSESLTIDASLGNAVVSDNESESLEDASNLEEYTEAREDGLAVEFDNDGEVSDLVFDEVRSVEEED